MALQQPESIPKDTGNRPSELAIEPAWGHITPTHRHPWAQFAVSNGLLAVAIVVLLLGGRLIDGPAAIAANLQTALSLICIHIMLAIGLLLVVGTSGQISLGQAGFYGIGAYVAAWPLSTQAVHLTHPGELLSFYTAAAITLAAAAVAAAIIIGLIRLSQRIISPMPVLLLSVLVLWCVIDLATAAQIGRQPYLVWSHAGPGLRAIHDATFTALAPTTPESASILLGMLILIVVACLAAGAAAGVISLTSAGRSPIHLLLLTLILAVGVRSSLWSNAPAALPPATGLPIFTGCAIAALLAVVMIWRIVHSQIGRAMETVREDAVAAATIGIAPRRQQMLALVLGAAVAGIAGALRTQVQRPIDPIEFGLAPGIVLLAIVVIGGRHSISGTVIAAAALSIVPVVWPDATMGWYALLAVGMIVMLRRRPDGLLAGSELWPPAWNRKTAIRESEATR